MSSSFRLIALLAAIAAAPALAAEPDAHASHHPGDAASAAAPPAPKSDATPAANSCQMMNGRMTMSGGASGQGMSAMPGSQGQGGGQQAMPRMAMGGKDIPCMQGAHPAATDDSAHSHDHAEPQASN